MIPGSGRNCALLRTTPLASWHPASRLAILFLGIVTALAVGPLPLMAMALAVGWCLTATGWTWHDLVRAIRPWLPLGALVLTVHTLTTVEAAPLGHSSWLGLAHGGIALLRVMTSLGWLMLIRRESTLDDLTAGVAYWLRPARRLGLPVENLGLMLAVAMGTVPAMLFEGRRIESAVRMRRMAGPTIAPEHRSGRLERWRIRTLDRVRIVVPLLESLGRRADALALTLRSRSPRTDTGRPVPFREALVLAGWLAGLAALAVFRSRMEAA